MRYILIVIIIAVVFLCIIGLKTRSLIVIGTKLSENTLPFERFLPNATYQILAIGDSSGVGVGAKTPELSVIGRLARDIPSAGVTNLGVSGARTSELIPRLQRLQNKRYDLTVIQIGGNDIVRFTNYKKLNHDIREVLTLATNISDNVILLTSGNVGTSQLLPFGSRWIFTQRTKKVREIFIQASKDAKIPYVDIYGGHVRDGDPYLTEPHIYYSPDRFHPSAKGYENWYSYVREILILKKIL